MIEGRLGQKEDHEPMPFLYHFVQPPNKAEPLKLHQEVHHGSKNKGIACNNDSDHAKRYSTYVCSLLSSVPRYKRKTIVIPWQLTAR